MDSSVHDLIYRQALRRKMATSWYDKEREDACPYHVNCLKTLALRAQSWVNLAKSNPLFNSVPETQEYIFLRNQYPQTVARIDCQSSPQAIWSDLSAEAKSLVLNMAVKLQDTEFLSMLLNHRLTKIGELKKRIFTYGDSDLFEWALDHGVSPWTQLMEKNRQHLFRLLDLHDKKIALVYESINSFERQKVKAPVFTKSPIMTSVYPHGGFLCVDDHWDSEFFTFDENSAPLEVKGIYFDRSSHSQMIRNREQALAKCIWYLNPL